MRLKNHLRVCEGILLQALHVSNSAERVDIGGWYGIMEKGLKTEFNPILIITVVSLIQALFQQKKSN